MKRSLTTVSSRGCPYACAFCYRGSQGERNYGMRTAEDIAIQIKEYVNKYNLDFIGFAESMAQNMLMMSIIRILKELNLWI